MNSLYKFYFDIRYEKTIKNYALKYSFIVFLLAFLIMLGNTIMVFVTANRNEMMKSVFCISNTSDYLWEKEGAKNIIFDARTGWKTFELDDVEIGCQIDDGKDNIGSIVLKKTNPQTVFAYAVDDVTFQAIFSGKAIDYYIDKEVDGRLRTFQSGILPDGKLDEYFQKNGASIRGEEIKRSMNHVMDEYRCIVQKLYRKTMKVFLVKRIAGLFVLLWICNKMKICIHSIVETMESMPT